MPADADPKAPRAVAGKKLPDFGAYAGPPTLSAR